MKVNCSSAYLDLIANVPRRPRGQRRRLPEMSVVSTSGFTFKHSIVNLVIIVLSGQLVTIDYGLFYCYSIITCLKSTLRWSHPLV